MSEGSQNNQECDDVTARARACLLRLRLLPRSQSRPVPTLADDGVTHPRGYSVTLTQPIFEGFQNLNAIRQAKSTVQAGREGLRATSRPRCSTPPPLMSTWCATRRSCACARPTSTC